MPWAEISISVTRDSVTPAETALEELGALAITFEDDADNPVLEPDLGTTPLWPTVHVRGLFESDVNRQAVMDAVAHVPGADRPENLRWRNIGDQDWERAWLDRFQPMRFGERLWIVPTGMKIPEESRASHPEPLEIRLDPGLAFGTGTHPTTALCLEWLDGHDCSGQTAIDYGCGSGILAIAAALKGATLVECVDTDPQALQATMDNARRNQVGHMLKAELPQAFSGTPAHLVLANILAGPLIELAPLISAAALGGSPLVLSGILEPQAESVIEAYRPWCTHRQTMQRDEWVRLDLVRK